MSGSGKLNASICLNVFFKQLYYRGKKGNSCNNNKKKVTFINDMAAELRNNSYSVALFKLFHSAPERGCYVYIMKRDKAEGGHNESGREPICWTDRTLHLNVSPAVCCRAFVLHWISLGMRYSQFFFSLSPAIMKIPVFQLPCFRVLSQTFQAFSTLKLQKAKCKCSSFCC